MKGSHAEAPRAVQEVERLALVAQRTSDAVAITDSDGRINWINEGFVRLTGYHACDVLGRTRDTLLLSESTDALTSEALRQAIATGGDCRVEMQGRRKDGSDYASDLEAQPLRDDAGRISGFIIIERDVTAQVAFRQRLIDSEQWSRSVLEAALDAVVSMDSTGCITCWNAQAERVFGWSRAEALGAPLRDLIMPPEGHEAYRKGLARFLATGESNLLGRRFELEAQRKDGTRVTVELAITPITTSSRVSFTAFLRDVTEPKRLQTELQLHRDQLQSLVQEQTQDLRRAKETAEQANQAKSEFFANMSHELRTPMHGILSFAQLGEEKAHAGDGPRLLRYFNHIHNSGNRLLQLLNDLLDLSKLDAGQMRFNLAEHDVSAIVATAISEMSEHAARQAITLHIEPTSVDTRVVCDRDRLLQVFCNVLANATKFSPPNSTVSILFANAVVRVTSHAGSHLASALAIGIRDHGIGIPDGELELIFDKFAQSSKTKSSAGGTGLGLTICRQIIDGHRGSIVASNNHDGGATFSITLPRAKTPRLALQSRAEPTTEKP